MDLEARQENAAILLANRTYLYRLLQRLFGDLPTLEVINYLDQDHTRMALSLLSIEAGRDQVQVFLNRLQQDREQTLENCRLEYTRLFIGPDRLPAPPWESVYVSKERLVFQESTLKVRQRYLNYGFLPVHYRSEPDDHIALELDFMYHLCQQAETAFTEGDFNRADSILQEQKEFLEQHLLVWVPTFVHDLKSGTDHPFYLGLADILQAFLEIDLKVINELIELF